MLIHLFRKTQWHTPFLLLIIGAVLWFDAFMRPEASLAYIRTINAPLYNLFEPFVSAYPLAANIFSFLLLFFQVYLVNYVATSKAFTDKYSGLTALFYLLLMSSTPGMIAPHPVLFSNLFLLLALNKIFNVYREKQVRLEVFNVGLLIALAGLFYYPAMVFVFLLLIALFVYYQVNIKAFFATLLGFLTPFAFLWLYYFMQDKTDQLITELTIMVQPMLIFEQSPGQYEKLLIYMLALLSLFSFFRLQFINKRKRPIRIRKRINLLFLFFLFAAVSYFLTVHYLHVHYGLMMIPLSVALGSFFYEIKRKKMAETLFTVFFLLILAARFAGYIIF